MSCILRNTVWACALVAVLLPLTVCAETEVEEEPNILSELDTNEIATDGVGACYRRSGCIGEIGPGKMAIQACWVENGASWKSPKGDCLPNPDIE